MNLVGTKNNLDAGLVQRIAQAGHFTGTDREYAVEMTINGIPVEWSEIGQALQANFELLLVSTARDLIREMLQVDPLYATAMRLIGQAEDLSAAVEDRIKALLTRPGSDHL